MNAVGDSVAIFAMCSLLIQGIKCNIDFFSLYFNFILPHLYVSYVWKNVSFFVKKKKKKEEKYVFGHPVNWNLFNLYLSYRKDSDISWNFHLMENPPPQMSVTN